MADDKLQTDEEILKELTAFADLLFKEVWNTDVLNVLFFLHKYLKWFIQ